MLLLNFRIGKIMLESVSLYICVNIFFGRCVSFSLFAHNSAFHLNAFLELPLNSE